MEITSNLNQKSTETTKARGNAHRMRFYRTRFVRDLTDNVGRAISSSDVICQIPYKNLTGRPIKSHAKKRCHRPKARVCISWGAMKSDALVIFYMGFDDNLTRRSSSNHDTEHEKCMRFDMFDLLVIKSDMSNPIMFHVRCRVRLLLERYLWRTILSYDGIN